MSLIGYIVLGIAAFMLSIQAYAWLDARRARGRKIPTGSNVPGLNIPETGPALLYFHSPSCMACRPMTPVIRTLATERKDVHAIDAHEHSELARAYGIRGTPTLVRIKDGHIDQILLGTRSEVQIRALLDAA
ncbi:MAG: thioredoxin family protein [Gammaproteobacteria bacterium]|nr:thioredoxin family protein [Gammaproteobacteria bacterium]MCP5137311.1 thioredoxin family protein [Gammaproteobacteria bacterium]